MQINLKLLRSIAASSRLFFEPHRGQLNTMIVAAAIVIGRLARRSEALGCGFPSPFAYRNSFCGFYASTRASRWQREAPGLPAVIQPSVASGRNHGKMRRIWESCGDGPENGGALFPMRARRSSCRNFEIVEIEHEDNRICRDRPVGSRRHRRPRQREAVPARHEGR